MARLNVGGTEFNICFKLTNQISFQLKTCKKKNLNFMYKRLAYDMESYDKNGTLLLIF